MRLHKEFVLATLLFALAGATSAQTRSMRVDLKDTRNEVAWASCP